MISPSYLFMIRSRSCWCSGSSILLVVAILISPLTLSFSLYDDLWILICAGSPAAQTVLLTFGAMSAGLPQFTCTALAALSNSICRSLSEWFLTGVSYMTVFVYSTALPLSIVVDCSWCPALYHVYEIVSFVSDATIFAILRVSLGGIITYSGVSFRVVVMTEERVSSLSNYWWGAAAAD